MFITERIKMALRAYHDRSTFTLGEFDTYYNGNGSVGALTRDQLSKALRAQHIIRKVKPGVYRLRGRKTPART